MFLLNSGFILKLKIYDLTWQNHIYSTKLIDIIMESIVWGSLSTLEFTLYQDAQLQDEVSTAGQSKNCSYCFERKGFINTNKLKLFKNISKKHFEILKVADDSVDGYSVYFKSLSLNPSYVNNRKIVHGQQIKLLHCSIIALGRRWNEVFLFRFFKQDGHVSDFDSDSDTIP